MRVASLFAGCGGSSMGYRAAGLTVRYACELNAVAADVYALNADEHTVLDRRSIRKVQAAEIIAACGGVPDILDGSPPCQDFTHLGKRDLDGQNASLYYEFVRLVGELQPRAFAAENVVGFVSGASYCRHFIPVLAALRGHGYVVQARTLDASWLGVPQARRRVILIGVRSDLGTPMAAAAAFPKPNEIRTVIRDALPSVARIIRLSGTNATARHYKWRAGRTYPASDPAPTITCAGMAEHRRGNLRVETTTGELRPLGIADLLALCGFPAEFSIPSSVSDSKAWKLLGNAVPPPMAQAWATRLAATLDRAE